MSGFMFAGLVLIVMGLALIAVSFITRDIDANIIKSQAATINSLEKIIKNQKDQIESLSSTIESKDKVIKLLQGVDQRRWSIHKLKNGGSHLKVRNIHGDIIFEDFIDPPLSQNLKNNESR